MYRLFQKKIAQSSTHYLHTLHILNYSPTINFLHQIFGKDYLEGQGRDPKMFGVHYLEIQTRLQ